MIYLLLALLILLFFISYYLTGRDFFAPSTMMTLTFAFSTVFSIYFLANLDYDVSGETVWIIFSCLLMSVIINVAIHHMFLRVKVTPKQEKITHIPNGFHFIMFAIIAMVALEMIGQVVNIVGGASNIAEMLVSYRQATYYASEETQTTVGVRVLSNLLHVLAVIYVYDFFRFHKHFSRMQKVVHIVIMILCVVVSLISAARFWAFTYVITAIFMFHMVRIQQTGGYKVYHLKFLLKIAAIVLLAAWAFYMFRKLVWNSEKSNLLDYTAAYVGTGIVNFDLYLKDPVPRSTIFGQETFSTLNNTLQQLGILDFESYAVHKEFRYLLGTSTGNVYTAFRVYHRDFGIIGVYILHSFFSAFFSYVYEYTKKRRSGLLMLILGSIYYPVMDLWYDGHFYINIVGAGTVLSVILLAVFYHLILRKDIRLRLKR